MTATVECYRLGEAVDTIIFVNGRQQSSPARHLVPLFGIQWDQGVRFEKDNILGHRVSDFNAEVNTFSMQFEDGIFTLPSIPLVKDKYDHQKLFLEKFVVRFTKSKSGVGIIHAVETKDIIYSIDYKPYFVVMYEWIDEPTTSPEAGYAIMFLSILIFAVYFFVASGGATPFNLVQTRTSQRSKKV